MLYALRRFVKDPIALEKILYYFFFVLGAADCEEPQTLLRPTIG